MTLLPEAKLLIEEEEKILAEVLESLRAQAMSGQIRFSTEQDRAKELTAELVASRRDEEKQMLASDEALSHRLRDMKHEELKGLDKLLDRPYFARLVLEEEINGRIKQIEYKLGTVGNSETRIVDWRKAALAKLYYEYKEGDRYFEEIQEREREGKILKRHKIEIENGRLVGLSCAYGNFQLRGGEWELASGATRQRRSSSGLPDVLSLITPDQFRLITEDAETAVLIQGVAGSGKTTVALHRLAWLLHDDNSQCRAVDSLIIVRGKVLRDYIAHSLGHLEIGDVAVKTTSDWLKETVAAILGVKPNEVVRPTGQIPPSNYRLKHSIAFLRAMDDYCDAQRLRFNQFIEEKLQLEELPETAALDVIQCLDTTTPLVPMAKKVVQQLQEAAKRYANNPRHAEILRVAVTGATTALQRIQLYREDIAQILADGRALLDHDESNLLDVEVIKAGQSFAESCKQNRWIEASDDALLCYLYQKKTGTPIRLGGLGNGFYSHIVVDEVQDHSPIELAVITQSVKESDQLTLAGDSGQDVRSDSSFIGWEQLQKFRGFENSSTRYVQLEVSYRSTAQIMRFANHIRGLKETKGGRNGPPPLWYHCLTEESGVKMALDWLNRVSEKFPSDAVAVICSDHRQLQYIHSLLEPSLGSLVRVGDEHTFTFGEGIVVTCVNDVKGLEFPHVLSWNPSEDAFPATNLGRNKLYVTATRAEEHLTLVSWDKPSKLLPNIHSKLVRGIPEEVEEVAERRSVNQEDD